LGIADYGQSQEAGEAGKILGLRGAHLLLGDGNGTKALSTSQGHVERWKNFGQVLDPQVFFLLLLLLLILILFLLLPTPYPAPASSVISGNSPVLSCDITGCPFSLLGLF
jgi:hypothetical protein